MSYENAFQVSIQIHKALKPIQLQVAAEKGKQVAHDLAYTGTLLTAAGMYARASGTKEEFIDHASQMYDAAVESFAAYDELQRRRDQQ